MPDDRSSPSRRLTTESERCIAAAALSAVRRGDRSTFLFVAVCFWSLVLAALPVRPRNAPRAREGVARLRWRRRHWRAHPARAPVGEPFERFERALTDRHYGGFGVGLWLSQEIVQARAGSISMQSEPDRVRRSPYSCRFTFHTFRFGRIDPRAARSPPWCRHPTKQTAMRFMMIEPARVCVRRRARPRGSRRDGRYNHELRRAGVLLDLNGLKSTANGANVNSAATSAAP